MKKHILTTILILVARLATAQQPVVISVGAGINNSSSSIKTEAYLGNGYNIHGDIFIPFYRKGWDGSIKGSGKFALGMVAGGSYFTAKGLMPELSKTQETYKLYSGSLDIYNVQREAAINPGFTTSAGLQFNILLGSLTLSPILRAGYFSLKQGGFEQRSSVLVNGTAQDIILKESPEVKNTGFIFMPQLKISYPIATNLSVYTSAAMGIGPKLNSTQSHLVPAGGFNEKNTYEPSQLNNGKMVDQVRESNYQNLTINAGISWNFGGSSRRLRGKVTKPGDGGMISALVAGQPIGGIVVKGGKNPGGNMMIVQTNDKGELELNGLEAGNYTFMLSPINESQETGTAMVTGQPIGGIVVKGGKNPGGNLIMVQTNDKGAFSFHATEAGNYKFTVSAPAGRSISEKGVK